jgi:hypothetical protein
MKTALLPWLLCFYFLLCKSLLTVISFKKIEGTIEQTITSKWHLFCCDQVVKSVTNKGYEVRMKHACLHYQCNTSPRENTRFQVRRNPARETTWIQSQYYPHLHMPVPRLIQMEYWLLFTQSCVNSQVKNKQASTVRDIYPLNSSSIKHTSKITEAVWIHCEL